MLLISSILNPITYLCFSSSERLLRISNKGQFSLAPDEKTQFTRSPNKRPRALSEDFSNIDSIQVKPHQNLHCGGFVLLSPFYAGITIKTQKVFVKQKVPQCGGWGEGPELSLFASILGFVIQKLTQPGHRTS
jgi:hypothetical protein